MSKTDYGKLRDEAIERKFANIKADKEYAFALAARDAEIAALRGALEKTLDNLNIFVAAIVKDDMIVPMWVNGCIDEAARLLTPATPQARKVPDGGEREGR